jgi:beta-N-acetylhexosaminidase
LPRINLTFDELWERELVPYRILAREGVPAVMTGHLAFPRTPGGETPASLSPWFMQYVLKELIQFEGLIITDDLMRHGATNYTRNLLPQASKLALAAGNDIIMFSHTPTLFSATWVYLLQEMRVDPVFHNRVRDAAARIVASKLDYYSKDNHAPIIPDLQKVGVELQNSEGNEFFVGLAARSATVVKGNFPFNPDSFGRVLLAGQHSEFFNAGRRAFPQAQLFRYSLASSDLAGHARNADTIIFSLADGFGARMLRTIRGMGKRVIVLSILSPAHLMEFYWVDGAVAVYSYAPESFNAGFSAMMGRIPAEGRLPFIFNGR